MTINSKATNACHTIVEPGDEITVEPLGGYPVIRDLVVDLKVYPYATRRIPDTEGRVSKKNRQEIVKANK